MSSLSPSRHAPPRAWQLFAWAALALLIVAVGSALLFAAPFAALLALLPNADLTAGSATTRIGLAGAGAVGLVTLTAWACEWRRLQRGGGARVARWAGGRLLDEPASPREKRLLVQVEQIAVDTQLPRPQVYLLEREDMINSFVCGWGPADLSLAVTRGALERLQSAELQGLLAFGYGQIQARAHRLHMHVIAVSAALLCLRNCGWALLRPAPGRDRALPLTALAGHLLLIAGASGLLAALLLQNRMARWRVLHADVFAVRYTRSREGLGQMLRKLWFQTHHARDAHQRRLHHLPEDLLATVLLHHSATLAWLPTHPPLAERVRRVFGRPRSPLIAGLIVPTPAERQMAAEVHGRAAASPVADHSAQTAPASPPFAPTRATLAAQGALAEPTIPKGRTAPAAAPAGLPTASSQAAPSPRATPAAPAAPAAPSTPARPAPQTRQAALAPTPQRSALHQLLRADEQRAALLACFLTPGEAQDEALWWRLVGDLANASAIFKAVQQLSMAEQAMLQADLLHRFARMPHQQWRLLADATQQLARSQGRRAWARNRLRWQVIRCLLNPEPSASDPDDPATRNLRLPDLTARQQIYIATFTALLAHLVPHPTPTGEIGAQGEEWYYAAMSRSAGNPKALSLPPDVGSFGRTQWDLEEALDAPDQPGLDRALWGLQELPAHLREELMRIWLEEALLRALHRLSDEAAAALHLACLLLNVPVPPALAANLATRHLPDRPL